MRIAFFSLSYPTPWQPAAAAFNRTMVRSLAANHDVRVVAPVPWTQRLGRRPRRDDGPAVEHPLYLYPPRLLPHRLDAFLWMSCRSVLRRLAREFAPDVYLAYWSHPDGAVALRAAREAGRPCVVIVGGSDIRLLAGETRRREAIRRVLSGADAVLTVGDDLRERVIELGVPAASVTAFRRGVDTATFHPGDRSAARARLALPEGPIALWVGRMVPVKGLDVLLAAWPSVTGTRPDARLYLVGDGPELGRLRRLAVQSGLSGTVALPGPRAQGELADWFRAADVTVLPSLSEGIPNVLLESLACGTPFVASDLVGVREIGAGEGCERVPAGDSTALAEALVRRLREPCRSELPSRFSSGGATAAIEQALEAAVRRRPPQA